MPKNRPSRGNGDEITATLGCDAMFSGVKHRLTHAVLGGALLEYGGNS